MLPQGKQDETSPSIEYVLYNPKMKLKDYEREVILKCLEYNQGSIYKTLCCLGIARETLYRKLRSYGIKKTYKAF